MGSRKFHYLSLRAAPNGQKGEIPEPGLHSNKYGQGQKETPKGVLKVESPP